MHFETNTPKFKGKSKLRNSAEHSPVSSTKKHHGGNPLNERTPTRKGKGRARDDEDSDEDGDQLVGPSPLLDLPTDILPSILSLLPPRSLLTLRLVCSDFNHILTEDSLWRESFLNHFLQVPDNQEDPPHNASNLDVLGTVRSCVGNGSGGYGWKKESLEREMMLERFLDSRSSTVISNPHIDVIHSLSLFYTPPQPPVRNAAGQIINRSGGPSDPSSSNEGTPKTPALPKVLGAKHRQPHRQEVNGTYGTGRAPNIVSLGMNAGVAARGDPLIGKTMQGHLGPGQISSLNDVDKTPTSYSCPKINPVGILWGLRSGHMVFSTLANPLPTAGRFTGTTVKCHRDSTHHGPVKCVWMPENVKAGQEIFFASGGEDGRTKLWNVDLSNKQGSVVDSIICVWTSPTVKALITGPMGAVGTSHVSRADPIDQVRFDLKRGFVVASTTGGDLWLFTGILKKPADLVATHRLVEGKHGSTQGTKLEINVKDRLDTSDAGQSVTELEILLHVKGESGFTKVVTSISEDDEMGDITETIFTTSSPVPLTCFAVDFSSPASISQKTNLIPADFAARLVSPTDSGPSTPGISLTPEEVSTPRIQLPSPALSTAKSLGNQPFVVAGSADGRMFIWMWNHNMSTSVEHKVEPVRSWEAGEGAITSVAAGRSLIASGSFEGLVKVWDPLPNPPTHLRTLLDRHISSPSSYPDPETHAASYYSVNSIILESDMVIAAIGTRILGWRAGTTRVKDSKKVWKGQVIGKQGSGKSAPAKGFDHSELREELTESKNEIEAEQASARRVNMQQAVARAHYEEIGLESMDEAIQLAMMMSREEEKNLAEEQELQEALQQIELLEEQEKGKRAESNGCDYDMSDDPDLLESLQKIAEMERQEAGVNGGSSKGAGTANNDPDLERTLRQIEQMEREEVASQGHRGGDDVSSTDEDDLELQEILAQIREAEERNK